jgi:hypothetical protein
VTNPGWIVDESFMQTADVVVTFEDSYDKYVDAAAYPANPSWMANYSRFRFWHLVNSVPTIADMQNAVRISRERNAGYVYVTSADYNNAYLALVTGTYWTTEMSAVMAP